MIDQPVEQTLNVEQMHAATTREGDNPPTLLLILDVEHMETGHTWRQSVSFSREQFVELLRLLAYAAEVEQIDWKQ